MNGEKPLTGVRKRQQIESANKQMLMWVAIAAVVVSVCFVIAINFIQRIAYQGKVNGKLGETSSTLDSSVESIENLKTEIEKLNANKNLNLANLQAKGSDSTALQIVIDALPTEDDRTALASSLQNAILAGTSVNVEQISVESNFVATTPEVATVDGETENSGDASSMVKPEPMMINFNLSFTGSYSEIEKTLREIERTIRTISIDSLDLQGSENSDQVQASASLSTWYVPKVDYQLGSEEVQP